MAEIDIVRRAYAKQTLAVVDARNQALEDAFATVAREAFLGPGPWPILRWGKGYVLSPSDDPVYLYSNDLVGIDPSRNLNNGQPSLHASLIDKADPQKGGACRSYRRWCWLLFSNPCGDSRIIRKGHGD